MENISKFRVVSRMLRSGGAAIHMLLAGDKIQFLVGESSRVIQPNPLMPFDDLVCDFLSALSIELLSDAQAKLYPDIISFAYWCRKANIERLKDLYSDRHFRLGLGITFHITPSNVPINFVFSYVFSLLAGNANIVRVPSKDFPQTDIVCKAINRLFKNAKYEIISKMTAFVKYEQNDEVTRMYSSGCNARIIWGGDDAIRNIRKIPIPERGIEIAFADRYSFCIIEENAILNLSDVALRKLVTNFYNDTYLMDQNACSSPHLIVWLYNGTSSSEAKRKFWESVYEMTHAKYELQPVSAIDKYTLLCENAIELNNIANFEKWGNYLYCMELKSLPENMDHLRGKSGFFYEYNTKDINNVAHIVNTKYQTLTYFGIDRLQLVNFVLKNRLTGIDRIVPLGSALDIGVVWDGHDLVKGLSRIIDCK
ncbi:MAG TPA: acyl-CoA reductase [Prolixibacteraceae bacterium]|jgi:hypothetical protein|nr:acyl-CoA reductase [Prolixibacteraceae bacterium]